MRRFKQLGPEKAKELLEKSKLDGLNQEEENLMRQTVFVKPDMRPFSGNWTPYLNRIYEDSLLEQNIAKAKSLPSDIEKMEPKELHPYLVSVYDAMYGIQDRVESALISVLEEDKNHELKNMSRKFNKLKFLDERVSKQANNSNKDVQYFIDFTHANELKGLMNLTEKIEKSLMKKTGGEVIGHFKRLKPDEIKPLLSKIKAGKEMTPGEKLLLGGTPHIHWHNLRKDKDLHDWEFLLEKMHSDSQLEDDLTKLKSLSVEEMKKADDATLYQKTRDVYRTIEKMNKRINGSSFEVKTASPSRASLRPLVTLLEPIFNWKIRPQDWLQEHKDNQTTGLQDFLKFTQLHELETLHSLREELDNLIQKRYDKNTKGLFKRLRPKDVEPLLRKAERGEPLTDEDKLLLAGTHSVDWHWLLRLEKEPPRYWIHYLKGTYEDSKLDEFLRKAKSLSLTDMTPSKPYEVYSAIRDVVHTMDLIKTRTHEAASYILNRDMAAHSPPAIQNNEPSPYLSHYLRSYIKREGDVSTWAFNEKDNPDPKLRQFLKFTHAHELTGLEHLLSKLDGVLTQSTEGEAVKKLFAQLAKEADENPDTLKYSHALDKTLGINERKVEAQIRERRLRPEEHKESYGYGGTPYHYIDAFLKELNLTKNDILYDMGSGLGRIPFYAALTTDVGKAVGLELIPERVDHCNEIKEKHKVENVEFRAGNVLGHDFSDGTVFFFFNPFTKRTLEEVGEKLKNLGKDFKVVNYGSPQSYFARQPWLEEKKRIPNIGVTIYEHKAKRPKPKHL